MSEYLRSVFVTGAIALSAVGLFVSGIAIGMSRPVVSCPEFVVPANAASVVVPLLSNASMEGTGCLTLRGVITDDLATRRYIGRPEGGR